MDVVPSMGSLPTDPTLPTDLMVRLQYEKKSAHELQKRKFEDWNDNYDLNRNKVKTNRLTQRQAVNIPLMKETVKTLLSKIDDAPNVDWKELSGDEDKEIIYQEIWNDNYKQSKLELMDVLDKKNVLLYGISTTKLNIEDYGICMDVLDIYDTMFDPLMESGEIETARFLVHQNIFKSVREILADDRYAQEGKDKLKTWVSTVPGITQSTENQKNWEEKLKRMRDMGVGSKDFPFFAGGDRIVNLTEHYTTVWSTKLKDWERRVVVYADDNIILLDETLKDLIGVDFWPFVIWSEDPETNDIYPDSVADLVRTPNKVLNIWYSQLIENRTIKNFQMHWFLPSQGYTPTTYQPGPGVMLPAPPSASGKISDVLQPVEISGLDDSLEAIATITNIVEKGSGATALDKGVPEPGKQTLGEIQILVGKANERTTAMAKFYRMAWYERAVKWNKLMHANSPKFLKLYKTGSDGKLYSKRVFAGDWKSTAGYEPSIVSSSEQETNTTKSIQKFMFILAQFPNNPALKHIAQKRMLEIVDLSPEEMHQVEEAEKQQVQAMMPAVQQIQAQEPQQDAGIASGIQQKIGELNALAA